MRLTMISKCPVCDSYTALWPEANGRRFSWRNLHMSADLGPIHPSCVEWEINHFERHFNMDLSPLKERLGLTEKDNEHTSGT